MANPDVITLPCNKSISLSGFIYQYRFDITTPNSDFLLHTLTNQQHRWRVLAIKNVKTSGIELTIKSGSSQTVDVLQSGANSGPFGAIHYNGWYFGETGQNLVLRASASYSNGCIHVAEMIDVS